MADRPRRASFLVAAAVAAGLLAACASMPTSGPVVAGKPVRGGQPYVYAPPDPPTRGDDPSSIVDGFIDAMATYEPNYEVARQFLTEEADSAWEPMAGASVYEGFKPAMEQVDGARVQLTQSVTGILGADGAFTPYTTPQTSSIELVLEQDEDGEWRIANPPPGLIISDVDFRREFEAYDIYFFDPTYSVLVPDPIYVPVNTRASATVLARSLLAGPTDWLGQAVRTAFPESAQLGVDSVPVERGTATVELGPEAERATPETRARMAAQLTWTLAGVDGVDQVEITAADTLLTIDGAAVSADDFREVDPSVAQAELPVYAVSGDGVVRIDGSGVVPVPGPAGSNPEIRELAVEPSGQRLAVVDDSGTAVSSVDLAGGGPDPVPLIEGAELIEPAWDRLGTVWALGLDESGRRMPLANVDGVQVTVPVAGLGDGSVYRLEPSPDGTRVAMVIGARAFVGLILRDVDAPSQVQIAGALRELPVEGDVRDVAWSTPGDVTVLTELDTESGPKREIFDVPLDGGPPVSRGSVEDAVAIAGMPRNPLVVVTSEGILKRQDAGVSWVEVGDGLTAPAYPQR